MLDQLHSTSILVSSLDSIPAWFLRLSAPVFCRPLAHLFNLSLSSAFIPPQWKRVWISPVPKITTQRFTQTFVQYPSLPFLDASLSVSR